MLNVGLLFSGHFYPENPRSTAGIPECATAVCHLGLLSTREEESGCDIKSLSSLSLIMAGKLAGGKPGTRRAERRG